MRLRLQKKLHKFLLCFLLFPAIASAQTAPQFDLPIACTIGKDCWPVNFFDHDASPEFKDHHCGWFGYDGHDGIDIAIGADNNLEKNMNVIAAADGKVVGTRNVIPDQIAEKGAVKDKECGNGARIDHGNGWFTQYCHMRMGSVVVKTGQDVKRGEKLGTVGLSGMTQFPHVHFGVFHNAAKVDPFAPNMGVGASCAPAQGNGLWTAAAAAQLRYPDNAQIYHVGVADHAPSWEEIRAGKLDARELSHISKLIIWFEAFTVPEGTKISYVVRDPQGGIALQHESEQKQRKIRIYNFAGLNKKEGWPVGVYKAEISLKSPNGGVASEKFDFSIK
jgi:hypothetical protein